VIEERYWKIVGERGKLGRAERREYYPDPFYVSPDAR
jgi:hypothetical protein